MDVLYFLKYAKLRLEDVPFTREWNRKRNVCGFEGINLENKYRKELFWLSKLGTII